MILKVTELGHPVLRQKTRHLAPDELKSPAIQRLIDDMIETMREYDGVGLAANQVYQGLSLAVLEVKNNPRYPDQIQVPLTVIVNPVVANKSKEFELEWEGCLSIPSFRGEVPRYQKILVNALDRHGAPLQIEAEGFHARVLQHEMDHLQGQVYLDRMKDLTTLTHLKEFARYWMK
jgi:peptide deformylase